MYDIEAKINDIYYNKQTTPTESVPSEGGLQANFGYNSGLQQRKVGTQSSQQPSQEEWIQSKIEAIKIS